jgi:hypothetical protein
VIVPTLIVLFLAYVPVVGLALAALVAVVLAGALLALASGLRP